MSRLTKKFNDNSGYEVKEYESLYDGNSVKFETKTGRPKMFD